MSLASYDTDPISGLDQRADELLELAQVLRASAGDPDSLATAPAVLRRLEEALQTLSAGWYELAADAAPAGSREEDARLMSSLHEVAAAFARCARSCRVGQRAVTR